MTHLGDLSVDSASSAMPVTTDTQGDQKTVLDLSDPNILLAERPDSLYLFCFQKKGRFVCLVLWSYGLGI